MTNTELLFELNDKLLPGLDQQKRFLLRQAYAKVACPNCACKQNQFEASGIAIDDWKFNLPSSQERFKCIECERELQVTVPPFVAGSGVQWHWRLVPIKTLSRAEREKVNAILYEEEHCDDLD